MKTRFIFTALIFLALPVFAQIEQAGIAPGATGRLADLLNKPAVVKPATATSQRNWYTTEMDAHVFTDQASFRQIVEVLRDIENTEKHFTGKNARLRASVVSRGNNETIADFTSVTPPLTRHYQVSVKIPANTDTVFVSETRQTPDDNETNRGMRNFSSLRYVEELTIDGKKYTYIRAFNVNDVYIPLPVTRSTVERNSDAVNLETLQLIIEAARNR